MLIIPGQFVSYHSLKDRTLKLVFESSEPTPEQLMGIATAQQTFGYLAFKTDPFKSQEKEVLENLESDYQDTGKSRAQRLRGVLFVNWQQDGQGYEIFDDYYAHHMEKMISHWKKKLP